MNEDDVQYPTDFSYAWKEGMVWVYCPHCASSEDDGLFVWEYVKFETCPTCGGKLERDENRR